MDPTNDIQLVIKQPQRRGSCGFSHGLIFARQIFPFETFTTHFYLLAAQGTSVRVILTCLLWINPIPHVGALLAPADESICSRFERKCNKEKPALWIYGLSKALYHMAVGIGGEFQMFVLWKEAGNPFNPSLSSWGEDARATWPRRAPNVRNGTKEIISVDLLFPLRNGRRLDFLIFECVKPEFKGRDSAPLVGPEAAAAQRAHTWRRTGFNQATAEVGNHGINRE